MLSGLIISVFLLIVSIIFGLTLFKDNHKEDKEKFSFLSYFPHELNVKTNRTQDIIFKILYVLSFLVLAFGFISLLFLDVDYNYYKGISFVVAFLGFLGCFSAIVLFFLNTRNIKLHLLYFTILVISSFIDSLAVAFVGFYSLGNGFLESIDVKKVVLASIISFIALVYLLVLIWPRKKKWYELDEINNNGVAEYKRPKRFYLAYMEWLSSALLFINLLFTLLMFI